MTIKIVIQTEKIREFNRVCVPGVMQHENYDIYLVNLLTEDLPGKLTVKMVLGDIFGVVPELDMEEQYELVGVDGKKR